MKQICMICSVLLGFLFNGAWAQESGKASFYHSYFNGKKTASGDIFDNKKLTCAHRSLPFGTMIKVTNLDNGKTVNVKVTDRGPYARGRLLDLTYAAAKELGFVNIGTANVMYELCSQPEQEKIDTLQFQPAHFMTLIPPDTALFEDYGIKIASYENADIGMKTAYQLSEKYGLPIIFESLPMAKSYMYRLFLGKFATETEASAFLKKLKKSYPDSYVVKYSSFK